MRGGDAGVLVEQSPRGRLLLRGGGVIMLMLVGGVGLRGIHEWGDMLNVV